MDETVNAVAPAVAAPSAFRELAAYVAAAALIIALMGRDMVQTADAGLSMVGNLIDNGTACYAADDADSWASEGVAFQWCALRSFSRAILHAMGNMTDTALTILPNVADYLP